MVKRIFIVFFFVFLSHLKGQVGAQPWKTILRTSGVDSVRIEAYNELAKIYAETDLPLARKYADSALLEIGIAEKQSDQLPPIYEKNKGMSYNTISHIDFQQGKFSDAIENCLKNIRIFEKFRDTVNISRLYGSLSQILNSIGNNKDALFYIRKAVKMDEAYYFLHKDEEIVQVDLVGSYVNLTNTFLTLGQYDSTLFYCNKALALIDTGKKTVDLGLIYTNIGAANGEMKKYPSAILYTRKALSIYEKLGLPELISISYSNLSEICMLTKDYTNALMYANLSEAINKTNSFIDNLLNNYDIKAKIYSELNDPQNEVLYLKKYAALKDSLLEQNHAIQMEELKTQYETEKKETEILKLNNENKIQDLRMNRLIITIISIVVVLLLLIGLAFFLVKIIRERKKAYRELQDKNSEIQKQGEQLSQQAKLISKYQSQMNPHFVFNALNSIQGTVLNDEKDKTIDRLQLLSKLMRQTLNNSENDSITLETEINYLKTYVEFEKQKLGKEFSFVIEYPDDYADILIPPMMIQPFIENAIKHAGLQHIKDASIILKIIAEGGLLKIFIKDNGEGFNSDNASFLKNSHALKIIQTRLELLFINKKDSPDIYFQIRSKPLLEHGTEVEFYLPLNYKY